MIEIAGDFMADLLDQRLGSSVVEPSIYRAHAAKFEVSDHMTSCTCVSSRHHLLQLEALSCNFTTCAVRLFHSQS